MKEELTLLAAYFAFFALFFVAFAFYRSTIYQEFHLGSVHYSMAIVEALVVSKLILLGQKFHLGEKLANIPNWLRVIYRSFIFCLFVLVMTIIEKLIEGKFEGKSVVEVLTHIKNVGYYEIIGRVVVVFFVFIPFFSFLITSEALGKKNFIELFKRK